MRKITFPYGYAWIEAKAVTVMPSDKGRLRADELYDIPPKPFPGLSPMQTALKRWMSGLPSKHYLDFEPNSDPPAAARPMFVIHGWTSSGESTQHVYMMKSATAGSALVELREGFDITFWRVLDPAAIFREPVHAERPTEKKRLMDFFFGKRRR
jgi:hypothetical protein